MEILRIKEEGGENVYTSYTRYSSYLMPAGKEQYRRVGHFQSLTEPVFKGDKVQQVMVVSSTPCLIHAKGAEKHRC